MIKHVVAIASGKGGVGKSTIALNLAFSLKQLGYTVGLLDADLYGPSLPLLLGASGVKAQHQHAKMQPITSHGIPTMSIGYLINEDAPAIWRGPIASKAIQQLFYETAWGDLDYLIIDLPPGTGDIHLTIVQKLPLKGSVIVTTPQQLSLIDVRRAITMLQKLSIPLIGIIENMSIYQCRHCKNEEPLFGEGGGTRLAQDYKTSLLGSLPLDVEVAQQSDQGLPIVLANPNNTISQLYFSIAQKIVDRLKHIKSKISLKVVVEQ